MSDFLATIIAFPTVVFTALLVAVTLYWLLVILGAADLDVIEVEGLFDALDGAVDGALEGAAEAGAEGLFEGAADGLDGGDVDLDGPEAETSSASGLAWVLHFAGLNGVPVTVSFSLVILAAWVLCLVLVGALGVWAPGWSGLVVTASLVAVASLLGGSFLASFAVRPLRPAFRVHEAPRRQAFVGQTCTIVSGRADATEGRAEISDGGAGLLVEVRCPRGELRRGEEGLVFQWDAESEVYLVSPLAEP